MAHSRGLIDAVVGLATAVLPLLAWICSATCTKITGIRFGGNNTGWINTKSTRHIVRTTAHLNAKKYYNTNSILFYIVGRGALHSVECLNFTGRCPGPPSNLCLFAPSFSSFGLILSIALANLSLVVIIIDTL